MSLVYNFSFPPPAAGETVTVTDDEGTEFALETIGSEVGTDGSVTLQVSLDEGGYIGIVTGDFGTWSTRGFLDEPDSIEAAANQPGASETDGVGAVFFGGASLAVPFDNSAVYCDFVVSDDPPRAPQRDDLMVVDEEDDTTINVIRSGLYDITLNTPMRLQDVAVEEGSTLGLQASVDIEINGGNEPPAYDYNNRAYWNVNDPVATNSGDLAGKTLNLTQTQVLLAGDTLQLRFKVAQSGGGSATAGTLHLTPDITMVCTFRGAVDPADFA